MASVGKYKALGKKLGGYKKTLYDVGSKEYAKQYEDVELERKQSIYSAVEDTLAQVVGISSEIKQMGKLREYGEQAKLLEGVEKRTETQKSWYGLGPEREVEKFFSVKTGKSLSQRELESIGYLEKFGFDTGYSEGIPTRPDVPFETSESEPIALEEKLTSSMTEEEQMGMFGKVGAEQGGMPDLTQTELKMKEPIDLSSEGYGSDRGLELSSMKDLPSLLGEKPKKKSSIGAVPHTMDMFSGDSSYRINTPENVIMDNMLLDDFDSIWSKKRKGRM